MMLPPACEQLRQDLVYAARILGKSPAFTLTACLTLILGIGGTTALFSVLHAVLLRSLPYAEPDRLVHVLGDDPRDARSGLPWRAFEVLRSANGPFSQIAATYRNTGWSRITFGGANEPELMQAGFTTASLFRTMGLYPLLGRVFDEEEERQRAPVAVLSAALWSRRFGADPGTLGRTIDIDGSTFTVIGVMPKEFQFPARDTQLWAPITTNRYWEDRPSRDDAHTRDYYMRWNLVARLRPGVDATAVDRYIAEFSRRMATEGSDWNMGIAPKVVPFGIELGYQARLGLFVLFGSVCLVLLIACANVANLLLARGAARRREFTLRAALGATQGRIVRQILAESLLVVLISGCGAILLAHAAIRVLLLYAPSDLPRLEETRIDWVVGSFTLVISLIAALFAGILPAVRAGRCDPNENIKAGGRASTDGKALTRTGALLVVSEFALTVLLLVAGGLFIRSLHAVQAVPLGFTTDNVLTAQIRPPEGSGGTRKAAFEEQVLARLRSLPGVVFAGGIQSLFELGRPPDNSLRAIMGRVLDPRNPGALTWSTVSGEYFQAMGIPLLAGRHFSERDTAGSQLVSIIDEALARRYWPNGSPVGQRFKGQDRRGVNDDWLTVIGVVRNTRRQGLEMEPTPHVYEWHKQAGPVTTLVLRTAGNPATLARAVRASVHEIEPRAVVSDLAPMIDHINRQTVSRRFQTWLLSLFAGLALILSVIGIYGVISYATARKAHELAIRIALGAGSANVVFLVLRQGMALALCGLGIGFSAALLVMHAISRLLYGVTATDAVTFAVVGVVLSAVAAAALLPPAWRAARVDPLAVLRAG